MSIPRSEVRQEMEEVRLDHQAFVQAKDAIQSRVLQLESDRDRYDRFVRWPGTQAALNVLTMCIVRCEGLLEDYQTHLDQAPLKLVQDTEK